MRRSGGVAALAMGLASGCHVWSSEPLDVRPVGEPFYEVQFSRGLGWAGREFVEVRPVSLEESIEMPRAVYAIRDDRIQRPVTTFLLPGYVLHVPLGVFGTGLYVKVAATDGDYHLMRFPLSAGPRDTIAKNVALGSLVVSADERFVVYTQPRTGSSVADSIVVLDRATGAEYGYARLNAVALLDIAPDGTRVAVTQRLPEHQLLETFEPSSGATASVAAVPVGAGEDVSFWRSVSWGAGGARAIYTRRTGTAPDQLWVVDQPGAAPRLLASAGPPFTRGARSVVSAIFPLAWLNDGERVVIIQNAASDGTTTIGVRAIGDGFTTTLGTGTAWVFPPVEQNIGATRPSLFPDGTRVLVRDLSGFRSIPVF